MKKIGDLFGLGILLMSIFIFMISLNQEGITKLVGLAGSSVTFIVEIWFLANWFKRT